MSTSDKNKEIGRRIKQLGIDHGYSVQKIAQDNHISYDTMSRVNRGIGISKEKVEMFAKYYDVSTDFKQVYFSLTETQIASYFPKGYTMQQMEEVILTLLDEWSKKEKR